MPIRMVDDPNDQEDFKEESTSGGGGRGRFPGGGGGGGLLNFLPLIFSLFRGGGGKGMLTILLIGAAAYFLFFRKGCATSENPISNIVNKFSGSGYSFNPDEFKKASVYEGLADDNIKNPLPETVSLLRFAPDRQDQGRQGSCVAWSSTYAARSIIEAASTGKSGNEVAFSPAFVYNQIGLEGCQGSYIQRAMDFMTQKGVVKAASFPYNPNDCGREPNSSHWAEAAQNRMHGFTRLTDDAGVDGINVRAVKEHLAKDAPVIIGMMVGGTFMEPMAGKELWTPTNADRQQQGFGGHAMCVIGYDDRKQAFQIMNSWGPRWGNNGVAWVKYADFKEFTREAYGIDPMPKKGAALQTNFDCSLGLVQDANKQYIPLKIKSGNVFETINKVSAGTRFKIEIKNSTECNVYLFGLETDNTSYTLFPYPDEKDKSKSAFSPYCGITGYRLFPRKKSLAPDNVGTKDIFAIVVSKEPLDWFNINAAITKSNQVNYGDRVMQALAGAGSANAQFAAGTAGSINFRTANAAKNAVVTVVEVNK